MASQKLSDAQKALNAAQDAERRRRMGPPLKLGDAAIDAASAVSAADTASAEAFWDAAQRAAGTGLDGLLSATPDEDGV